MGGDEKVFEDFLLIGLDQRIVDMHGPELALAGKLDGEQAAAGRAIDLDAVELRLHRLHLRFEFGGLFHQAEKISHTAPSYASSSAMSLSFWAISGTSSAPAAGVLPGWRTSTISAPGKRWSTACTSGSPRTSSFSSALRICACA